MSLTLTICLYNAEKYIAETLHSVMQQTMQDFHLLIVDDCSTDRSVAIVKQFFVEHPRQFELVSFESNQGICHARHFAECHATTKYLMFLDADDILLPNAIEKMYQKIASDNDLMAVGCYLDYIDEQGKKIGGGLFLGDKSKAEFIQRAAEGKLIFMQPTAIYDRDLALNVGGYICDETATLPDSGIRWQDYCEDLDLWTRMSDLYTIGKAIIVLPEVLCHYRKQNNGLSASSFRMTLRMRYVKANVRRRRKGLNNMTFSEFYNSLSEAELSTIKNDAAAADALRNGVFLLKDFHLGKGLYLIGKSIVLKPGYIVDKIRHNLVK